MKKNFFEWIVYILLFIWQIPQNLVGAIMWLYFKLCGDVQVIVNNKYSKVYTSKYMSGGISLGCFAFVSNRYSDVETVVLHEQGHMVDSKILGIFYLPIIGLSSILNAWLGFTKCYYSWLPEKLANFHAGLGVDENCRLYIKEKREEN